jgi:hypothetical protein
MGVSGSSGTDGGGRSRLGGGGGAREVVKFALEAAGFVTVDGRELPGNGWAAGFGRVPVG